MLRTTVVRLGVLGLLALSAVASFSSPALAAPPPEDVQVAAEYEKIVATDVADANFGQAKRRLKALVDRCARHNGACTAKTIVSVNLMHGILLSQSGARDQASAAFATALEADPDAVLPATADVTDGTKRLFADAQTQYQSAHPRNDDPYLVVWVNPIARAEFALAIAAKKADDNAKCIESLHRALEKEEQPGARLHLAECLDKTGKLVEALQETSNALDSASKKRDLTVARAASSKLEHLFPRLGHVSFATPANFGTFKITFDDRLVTPERLKGAITVDPGEHHLRAEGSVAGNLVIDDQTVTVKEGEKITIKLAPKPTAITLGQLDCLLAAKNEAQLAACLPKKESNLTIAASAELSGYADTQRVEVVSPYLKASITSPTQGWSIGGSFMADVVTAASADIVSTASRRFTDTRYAGTLFGGYKIDRWHFNGNAAVSSEHDYFSRGGGLRVAADLFGAQFTPEIGYGISLDTIGRTGVPFDTFSNDLTTQSFSASGTFVLSPRTLLILGTELRFEVGDQSKPYRYIPLFDAGTNVPNHASVDYVNAVRLPDRPLEQLPLERDRYALIGRYISRVLPNATLRLDERLYTDNWGIKASTTEARYLVDLGSRWRTWGFLRVNVQSAASFYARAYYVTNFANGNVQLPIVRTTDRELGSLLTPTPGLGARYALTPPDATVQMGVSLQGSVMFTKYFDAIYTGSRTAIYGTSAFDIEVK